MHNDLRAFPEPLNAVVGLTHVGAQVVLADIVDGQDAGEFCVSLLGTPLRYPLTPLCLSHPGEAQDQQASRGRPKPAKAHTPAQTLVALDAQPPRVCLGMENFPITFGFPSLYLLHTGAQDVPGTGSMGMVSPSGGAEDRAVGGRYLAELLTSPASLDNPSRR